MQWCTRASKRHMATFFDSGNMCMCKYGNVESWECCTPVPTGRSQRYSLIDSCSPCQSENECQNTTRGAHVSRQRHYFGITSRWRPMRTQTSICRTGRELTDTALEERWRTGRKERRTIHAGALHDATASKSDTRQPQARHRHSLVWPQGHRRVGKRLRAGVANVQIVHPQLLTGGALVNEAGGDSEDALPGHDFAEGRPACNTWRRGGTVTLQRGMHVRGRQAHVIPQGSRPVARQRITGGCAAKSNEHAT